MRRRHAILNKITLLEKGIKILDLECFMWTHMKQNYDKHVEQRENWRTGRILLRKKNGLIK